MKIYGCGVARRRRESNSDAAAGQRREVAAASSIRQSGWAVHVRRSGAGVRAELLFDALHGHVFVQSDLKNLGLQVRMRHM